MSIFSSVAKATVKGRATREKIKAFHGSPHDFDRFSSDNIGTGEGAQAYGHGLYFAEREGTATTYKKSTNYSDKKRQFQRELPDDADAADVMDMSRSGAFSPEMTELVDALNDDDWLGFDHPSQAISAALSKNITDYDPSPRLIKATNSGHMYEVDISASPDELLDYDAPLSEQSDKVKEVAAFYNIKNSQSGMKEARGSDIYAAIASAENKPPFNNKRKIDGAVEASDALNKKGIKGIKYADAQTRFSPKGRTNNYVMFDDKTIEIARKYGVSMPVAGAILAGTMTPEQAQAGPIANAIHIGQRIIDLGMLKADSINNPRAIKLATNKYNKLMKENEAFADRERKAYANGFETIFNPTELPPRKIITPEDLQGKTIAPVRGDRSDLGHLTQVGGQKVDVDVQAGKKFSRQNGGWASAEGIAQGQHAKLVDAAEDTQNDVVGVYNAMGEDSVNFSTPIAQGMFQQIPALQKLDLADVKKFDEEVRGFKKTTKKKDGTTVVSYPMKDWVGLDHPEAMSQIMGKDGYPKFGALRTVLTTTMSKAHYRDRGFPSYKEMVKAVEDPELAGANIGDAGISTYNVDAAKGIEPIDYHDSYSHRMPGDDNGGLAQSLPFEVFFPESYKRYRNTKTKSGKLMTHDQAIVAMNIRKDGYEVADQKWLDGVLGFSERNKKLAASGGAVVGAGALFSPDEAHAKLMTERDELAAMGSNQYGKASPELMKYRRSQILPTIGEMGMGILESTVDGIDFMSQFVGSVPRPKGSTPLRNKTQGVLDTNFIDKRDLKAIKEARAAGSLFSFL